MPNKKGQVTDHHWNQLKMGDCQSKNKAGDVSEPAIESDIKSSNESTKNQL